MCIQPSVRCEVAHPYNVCRRMAVAPRAVRPDMSATDAGYGRAPRSSPSPPAGRRRRSRWCACAVRRRALALESLIGRVPTARQATFARVRDPASGEVIDEALALWFPGPHSETGEDMAELQLHGGHAVIAAVLERVGRDRRLPARRARRVHAPGLRQRPSRSDGSGGPGRSDRRGNAGAAPAGVPAAQGIDRRPRRGLAAANHRGAGACRGANRFLR